MSMGNLVRLAKFVLWLVMGSLAAGSLLGACNGPQSNEDINSAESASTPTPTSTGLTLQVLTNSCGPNQVETFFEVTNSGSTAVPLSDIQIKFWPDDTSGQNVVPQVFTGGCVSDAGNPSCVHQVQGVQATPTPFTACGAAGHQANWEITLSTTDSALLPPGATWSNLQSQVHLANFGNFSPGTSSWYSSCVSGTSSSSYVPTGTFALYDAGQLVRTSTGVPPSCRAPSGSQTISGNVPPAVATAPLVGAVPGNTELTVSITLPLQVNGAPGSGFPPLTTFIQELSSPTGPRPAPLTPTTFAAAYGPLAGSYSNLMTFAQANGLTIVNTVTAQDLLTVTGTAAAIESAFFVTLNVYQRPDGTTFYAPANDPSVNLSFPVLGVLGLDNFSQATRRLGTNSGPCQVSPVGTLDSFFGPDFKNTYFGGPAGCASTLEGQGQTIALYELDSYIPADILSYAQGTNVNGSPLDVPGLNMNPPQLSNVTQEVAPKFAPVAWNATTFAPNFQLSNAEDEEVITDIQMVLAMAPQANIIVYEANQQSSAFNYATLLTQIANEDRAQVVSSSWGWSTSSSNEQMAVWNAVAQFAAQKQSFFEAAGDQGALLQNDPYGGNFKSLQPTNPGEPIIDSEYMTVVGATSMFESGAETTWNDTSSPRAINGTASNSVTTGGFCIGTSPNPSGGASFSNLAMPLWQANVNPGNAEVNNNPTQARMIPDVSIIGSDILVACSNCASPFTASCAEGTSAGAPLWAAFIALVNQANGVGSASTSGAVGFVNPTLYQLATVSQTSYKANFNDIADGSNNNWFDNGQATESGTVPPASNGIISIGGGGPSVPAIAAPYTASTDSSGNQTNTALQGAAANGVSEAPGLYHAFAGFDLATGLGTPTCGLLASLAPGFSTSTGGGTTPPPSGVTINYHQVGQCEGFPESTDFTQAGVGFGFTIFGLDSIVNNGTTPFNFDPGKLFAGVNGFLFDTEFTLASCTNSGASNCPVTVFPQPFPGAMTVPPGTTLTYTGGMLGTQFFTTEQESAIAPGNPGSVETSQSLSYSQTAGVSPINGGALDPNVTLIKSNSSAAQTASLPDVGDCTTITLQ